MKAVNFPVITVDGASGTGKGVVTQLVAKALGWNLLDSGAIYRVLALAAIKHELALEDEAALVALANHLDIQFKSSECFEFPHIFLENQEVTEEIRTEFIGNTASKISRLPGVRLALLEKQRAFRRTPGLVTDGRDMGTVVFPDASLKIFLTASAEERARRRYKQLKEKGINVNLGDLVADLRERDQRDSERAVAPLRPAADAVSIDTDNLNIDEVVARILSEVERVFPAVH